VDTLLKYRFIEERFRRNDPKKVVKECCNIYNIPWEYTFSTYDEVISKIQGKPLGIIEDKERACKEA
jgi:hypothetical protein